MKKKIIGVTVGTPISTSKIEDEINPVKTINGKAPDENGNIVVSGGGGGTGAQGVGIVDITISEVGGYTLTITDDQSNGQCELYINGVMQANNVGTWSDVTTVGLRTFDDEPWMLVRDGNYYDAILTCGADITTATLTKDETNITIEK